MRARSSTGADGPATYPPSPWPHGYDHFCDCLVAADQILYRVISSSFSSRHSDEMVLKIAFVSLFAGRQNGDLLSHLGRTYEEGTALIIILIIY